jgi:NADH-quinone oxidoreductase subunit E
MLRKERPEAVKEILSRYPPQHKRAAVMPMLYEAQDVYGYLPEEAIREVADILELDATEVYAVSEFYSLYYHKPVGKYIIRFCTDMPCALVGAEDAYQQLLDILGVKDGESTPDGMFTVEHCVCLAACGMAPVFLANRQYFENMTEEKMRKLINYIRTNGLPKDGPTLKSQERTKDTPTGF